MAPHPDRRPVPRPRTSAEARDLYSNVTESWTSPDGRLLPRDPTTPFGRQVPPRLLTPLPAAPALRGSRTVQRVLLQQEVKRVEDSYPTLLAENKRLRTNLISMIRMNEVMSRALRLELEGERE